MERKAAEEKQAAIAAEVDQDTYDNEIHRVIDDLEKETQIEEVSEEAPLISDQDEMLSDPGEAEPEEVIPERKSHFRLIISALTLLVLLTAIFLAFSGFFRKSEPAVNETVIEELKSNLMDPELRSMWLNNRQISEDYVGQIVFDSGLIDLPFVQAKDVYKTDGYLYSFYDEEGNLVEDPGSHTGNDVYIWTDWKTGEYGLNGDGGSVFMDYRNYLKDQNIILYGHHFARDYDPSGSKQFTPLDVLLTEENYEENKYLKLILDNEIRSYVVTNVFTINIDDEYESQIIRTDMNEDFSGNREPRFFREFIEYMKKISRYDTGEFLSDGDRILTLITCLEHQPQYRQIVVCKEIEDVIYE
ncbi:MAG: class B sortase [Erysipelotrichaceae bacterium]|nr:class B sortase [Erysipelotrichaceae bacterium]